MWRFAQGSLSSHSFSGAFISNTSLSRQLSLDSSWDWRYDGTNMLCDLLKKELAIGKPFCFFSTLLDQNFDFCFPCCKVSSPSPSHLHDTRSRATVSPDLFTSLSSASVGCAWLLHTFVNFPIDLKIFSYTLPNVLLRGKCLLSGLGCLLFSKWNMYSQCSWLFLLLKSLSTSQICVQASLLSLGVLWKESL